MVIVIDAKDGQYGGNYPRTTREQDQFDPPPNYLSIPNDGPRHQLTHSRSSPSLSIHFTSHEKPLPRIPPPPKATMTTYLEVIRTESSIKGSWTIHTSPTTQSSLDSFPDSSSGPSGTIGSAHSRTGSSASSSSGFRPNLRLITHRGEVDAALKLKGRNRAFLQAISKEGGITVSITDRQDAAFCLHVIAENGDSRVFLPHSFYGPIRCRWRRESMTLNGEGAHNPIFSSGMHDSLIVLSSEEDPTGTYDTASYFLGDLNTAVESSDGEDGEWLADEVNVELEGKRQAYFFWNEEHVELSSSGGGLLGGVKTRMKPLQGAIRPWRRKGSIT